MTESIEKPCTNLEYLSRQAGKQSKFWAWVRERLERHEDFCIVCPTLERAKETTEQLRKLVIELNLKSKPKVKVTHPFEKLTGQFTWWKELW